MKNVFDAVLQKARDDSAFHNTSLRFGSVTAVDSGTLTILLAGEEIPMVPYMRGSNPQVGDWAWLLHQGSLLVCIGFSETAPAVVPPTPAHVDITGDTWADEPSPWQKLPADNAWTMGGP